MKINTVIHNPYSLPLWCWVWHDMSDPAGCASYLMRLSLFGIGGGLNLSNRSRCTKDPNQKFIKKKYQTSKRSRKDPLPSEWTLLKRRNFFCRFWKCWLVCPQFWLGSWCHPCWQGQGSCESLCGFGPRVPRSSKNISAATLAQPAWHNVWSINPTKSEHEFPKKHREHASSSDWGCKGPPWSLSAQNA